VVALASVKSCFGHTEGTAGITGLLLAAAAAQQQVLPPVVNLRAVNPYVAAALGFFGSSSSVGVPRQAAPDAAASAVDASGGIATDRVAGTSSFGMSGVNAHMLLSPVAADAVAVAAGAAAPLPWERQRYWPLPQQHRLLQLPRLAGPGAVRFAAAVSSTAALGYLWGHVINGEPTSCLGLCVIVLVNTLCNFISCLTLCRKIACLPQAAR
jgi:hypothetical protein